MSESDRLIAIGFHEFFRYGIPGYGLVAVALIVISLVDPSKIPSSDLSNVIFWVISGPFVGFVIYHVIYYPIWTWYYKKSSDAYQEVQSTIVSVPKFAQSELKKKYEGKELLLVRCIWDRIYFTEENKTSRDRIQFLLTMMHSIGTTFFSIWIGFVIGLIYPTFLDRANLNINLQSIQSSLTSAIKTGIIWYWLITLLTLVVISILLLKSFFDRKQLAENQEYLLVQENHDRIKEATKRYL